MSLQLLTDRIKGILGERDDLDATLKFKTDEGMVFVDGKAQPHVISNENAAADCTLEVSVKNALKLLDGDLNPMMALMSGKLKIDGDMAVAMQVAQQFGGK
ncbi:SCP-2 sterol transfer family protein [Dyadobacter jejuensis]|uniref:SCP-2 sterol transfer family protein n=1 Tax=Dyadobacter jejuensis TaxID=1082580 RepID=A0A316AQ29_9BACT|nr:SCP2 sterol-binding domain-containing protein [Dyadobacter jejuensis]PWJ59369.1 SCP-2 sterol transfer family protein [Dyadobacter jejuensis]